MADNQPTEPRRKRLMIAVTDSIAEQHFNVIRSEVLDIEGRGTIGFTPGKAFGRPGYRVYSLHKHILPDTIGEATLVSIICIDSYTANFAYKDFLPNGISTSNMNWNEELHTLVDEIIASQ